LIRLAATHPEWVLGYADEVWWSRLQQPRLQTWSPAAALPLQELMAQAGDPDPKALACYGLLRADTGKLWLRFVAGRPVSVLTIAFLEWLCEQLQREGKQALLLVWDNASWHLSQQVRTWLKQHNRAAKRHGKVRILRCQLPTKSPWLNRIEPHWMHGKKAIVEPTRQLTAAEVQTRVCAYYGCELLPHLSN
jgi:transposase